MILGNAIQMTKNNSEKRVIPEDLKTPFLQFTQTQRMYSNILSLYEFALLTTHLMFQVDFEDEKKNQQVLFCREAVYEAFSNNKEFVDSKLNLVEEEVKNQSPILYLQATVSLWSGLESFIRLFISRWLQYNEDSFDKEIVKELKISFSEYHQMDEEDRYHYLTSLLEDRVRSSFMKGINRFESLLEVFGLSGKVDTNDKSNIFTLQQLRNCIVHNGAIADKKIIDSCPWLNLEVGDQIIVSPDDFNKYLTSVNNYVVSIFIRFHKYLGISDKTLETMKAFWERTKKLE